MFDEYYNNLPEKHNSMSQIKSLCNMLHRASIQTAGTHFRLAHVCIQGMDIYLALYINKPYTKKMYTERLVRN